MSEATPTGRLGSVFTRAAQSRDRVTEAVKYNFTRTSSHRHDDFFVKMAVYCLCGFGVLALVSFDTPPLNYIFVATAVGGFMLIVGIELSSLAIASLYQNGVYTSVYECVYVIFAAVSVVGTYLLATLCLFTLAVWGAVALLVPLVTVLPVAPGILHPVVYLTYLAGSVGVAVGSLHSALNWYFDHI